MRFLLIFGLLLGSSQMLASPVAYLRKGGYIEGAMSNVVLETKGYIIYRDSES